MRFQLSFVRHLSLEYELGKLMVRLWCYYYTYTADRVHSLRPRSALVSPVCVYLVKLSLLSRLKNVSVVSLTKALN